MRSSKSRSRSKANRPRSIGNIINRVFDSSGPEGKVRGTPQQIIEKYLFLARDAQLSNDRVAAENFLQHAEHYTRMLGEAQRELAAEQEARLQSQGQQGGNGQHGGQNGGQNGNGYRDRRDDRRDDRRSDDRDDFRAEDGSGEQPYVPDMAVTAGVIGFADPEPETDTGLVETPEARTERKPRERAPRQAEPAAEATADEGARRDRGPRRPRGPRKPKGEGDDSPAGGAPDTGKEAAE
jgi:hypothetical protein